MLTICPIFSAAPRTLHKVATTRSVFSGVRKALLFPLLADCPVARRNVSVTAPMPRPTPSEPNSQTRLMREAGTARACAALEIMTCSGAGGGGGGCGGWWASSSSESSGGWFRILVVVSAAASSTVVGGGGGMDGAVCGTDDVEDGGSESLDMGGGDVGGMPYGLAAAAAAAAEDEDEDEDEPSSPAAVPAPDSRGCSD